MFGKKKREEEERIKDEVEIQIDLLKDPDWAVRRQFAATIGALPQGTSVRESTAITLLERFGTGAVLSGSTLLAAAAQAAATYSTLRVTRRSARPRS